MLFPHPHPFIPTCSLKASSPSMFKILFTFKNWQNLIIVLSTVLLQFDLFFFVFFFFLRTDLLQSSQILPFIVLPPFTSTSIHIALSILSVFLVFSSFIQKHESWHPLCLPVCLRIYFTMNGNSITKKKIGF